jgi:predicted ATP-grasp superfamily ATP-dependent carboligase
MRTSIGLLWLCCACAQHAGLERVTEQMRAPIVAATDSLTPVERARIVEAAVRFRRMIFLDDTTTRLEGCSVALVVGAEYRTLLTRDVRQLVSEPTSSCGPSPAATRFTQRLIVRSIQGGAGEAVIRMTYEGGRTYTHEEDFKVKKASSRADGRWVATEMRVYDALIAD